MQASAGSAGGKGSGPVKRSQQEDEEHAGSRLECIKTTTINENKAAVGSRGDEEKQQDEREQQSAQAVLKAAEAGGVAALSLLSPLAQNTPLMLSTRRESGEAMELARRTWSSVASSGVEVEARRAVEGRTRGGGRAFSIAGVASGVLQQGDSKKTTNGHMQGLVSVGQAKGAEVVQDGGVMEASGVAAGVGERGNSMQAPSPWIPAARAGAAAVLAATVASHPNTDPAHSQGVQPTNDGVSQARPDSAEEQRTGALMEDSVCVGERSVPGHHNNEAQEWRRVSTSSGGVVSSSPPSKHCSDRSRGVVEPHGSLSLSFPVGMHPPTPHMGPLRMWSDGR